MPSSHPESSAFLLMECFSPGLMTLPLAPLGTWQRKEVEVLQPAVAHSQCHCGEQCCFHPAPCWGCLACCRGYPRASSPSPGWEGTEAIPCQLGWDRGRTAENVGAACSSREGRQLQSVILATEGCKSNLKNKESLRKTSWCLFTAASLG